MRLRNVYRILAAAVCAGVATYLTVSTFSARTPPSRPLAAVPDAAPAPVRAPDTKTVIVAARPLQFNAVLTAADLAEVQWPAASVPPGAFTSRAALLGPGGQRTALVAIAQNEPILASKVTGPGQRGSLSAVIEEGKKAVTIRVDDVLGVAGFVQPGDRVDVIWTRNERTPSASGRPATDTAYSVLLLQNVRVLAIDQIVDRGPQAKPARAVTIEVNAEGARQVALSANLGQLSLALLRAGSHASSEYRRTNIEDLGGPQRPGVSAPPPPQNAEPDGSVVAVTRGTERSFYEFTDSGRREIKLSNKTTPPPPSAAPRPE
jgi:pilus assembly protein CpaB